MSRVITLGDAIKLLREQRATSARALSIECGFSAAYVNKVENGDLEPSLKAFAKLARVLEMTDREIVFLVMEEAE